MAFFLCLNTKIKIVDNKNSKSFYEKFRRVFHSA